jgi:hypothetical protein
MIKVIRTYVITLIFTICILFGISQYQEVFAINYNGTEIDGAPDYNEHTLLVSDSNYYYLISHTDSYPLRAVRIYILS